jgi:hypothetical protein
MRMKKFTGGRLGPWPKDKQLNEAGSLTSQSSNTRRCECDWPGAVEPFTCWRATNPNAQADSGFQNLDSCNTSNSHKLVRKQGSLQQWDTPVAAHRLQPLSLMLYPSRLPLTRRAVARILAAIGTAPGPNGQPGSEYCRRFLRMAFKDG